MLVLVRHGESSANAQGLLLGRLDAPLTERGRAQARAVGAVLGAGRSVTAVRTSPLARARDTAAALHLGPEPEVDERWVEVDYGAYDGQPLTGVPAEVWRRWRDDPAFRPPGGETLAEVAARVSAACGELFAHPGRGARQEEGDVVVVSHVTPIKAAVAWALGAGPELSWKLVLSTGSVTRLGWGQHHAPVVHTFNEVPAVAPPGGPAEAAARMRA